MKRRNKTKMPDPTAVEIRAVTFGPFHVAIPMLEIAMARVWWILKVQPA